MLSVIRYNIVTTWRDRVVGKDRLDIENYIRENKKMSKIHYATGGLITPEYSEFSTLCKRKFPRGGSDIMQSGYSGAKNVTCKDCRKNLDEQEVNRLHREKIEQYMQRGWFDKLKIVC